MFVPVTSLGWSTWERCENVMGPGIRRVLNLLFQF